MKKGLIIFVCIVLVFSMSFTSASWIGDIWNKLTGSVTSCEIIDVYTFRDRVKPTSQTDGDSRCEQKFPGTHWCSKSELNDKQTNILEHKGFERGTRSFVYSSESDGCNNGFICSVNNWETCEDIVCENYYCSNEGLVCCKDNYTASASIKTTEEQTQEDTTQPIDEGPAQDLNEEISEDDSQQITNSTQNQTTSNTTQTCGKINVQTYRERGYTPSSKRQGDLKCHASFPGSHWCSKEELDNKEVNILEHQGYTLGTRAFVYSNEGDGCNNGIICSGNDWQSCGDTTCENRFCSGEGLVCCGGKINMEGKISSDADIDMEEPCEGADINMDGVVDELDKNLLENYYGTDNFCEDSNSWCEGTDIDKDGKVGLLDLSILGKYYGENCLGNNETNQTEINNTKIPTKNEKDSEKYFEKEVFLISDENWKHVLPFVPVTTWTGEENWCKQVYGTAENVCTYPTLIYHKENSGFDADSIVYFMQQYAPEKVTIIGNTPQELDNLLIAKPELGAGLNKNNVQRISTESYLNYWEEYKDVVYVEDNYELGLLASTYASLINAPLIIENSELDKGDFFENRNVICVGNVDRDCEEEYDLEELQEKYIDKTNTDKIILVNPDDLNIKVTENFQPSKSSAKIKEIYSKASLISPILASAKHEIMLSITSNDYREIDKFIEDKINDLNIDAEYLTIVSNPNVIPYREGRGRLAGSFTINYRALDPTEYADFDGDLLPDIAVGRIQGITNSDVSSYVARVLFYHDFDKNNNIKIMASSFPYMIYQAKRWANEFTKIGYHAVSSTSNSTFFDFNSSEWKNQGYISYHDHGYSIWAGIKSSSIPLLENSLVIADACSTCSTYNGSSFCNRAMRQGAIAYVGAVGTSWTLNHIFVNTINNLYLRDQDVGKSFSNAYINRSQTYMTTLIGDPTLSINPDYKLDKRLI